MRTEQYELALSLTNDMVASVEQAQASANLFLFTSNPVYLRQFQQLSDDVELKIDSLTRMPSQVEQHATLLEIVVLLQKKKTTIADLAHQFSRQGVQDSLSLYVFSYKPQVTSDSVIVTTVRQDTLLRNEPKQGFWRKLGGLFSSSTTQEREYNVTTTTQVNTITSVAWDTLAIASDMRALSEQTRRAEQRHSSALKNIERQVSKLMLADQTLSEEISRLLIKLHRQTLDLTFSEIQKNKHRFERSYTWMLVTAGAALLLVLIFVGRIIVDVNKSLVLRKALEEEKRRVEQLLASRHELLLWVSHDIKTPLASMLGYVDLCQADEAIQHKHRQWFSAMRNAANHILAMLTNLLDFSRLEQGKLRVDYSRFDVQELCRELAEMFEPLAFQKNIKLQYQCEVDTLQYVSSDRVKIKEIAVNLLSNAIKYTLQGEVRFRVYENENHLCLKVEDTGVGMSPEKIEVIFQPFSRLENASAMADGSGVGMYVVKGLINILQGNIQVGSEVGVGTQIEVQIPVEKVSKDSIACHDEEQVCVSEKSHRVLLVDDAAVLLTMLTQMLQRLGCTAIPCKSIGEFEQQVGNIDAYDVVLTDMDMGAASGLDVLRKVREVTTATPVFAMTAHGEFGGKEATQAGFNGCLSKPFSINLLANLLNNSCSVNHVPSDFTPLMEMFEGDVEVVKDILQVFELETTDNIVKLQQAVDSDDFSSAQALCHKMLPMFAQLDKHDLVEILKRMDSIRGKNAGYYPQWKDRLHEFMAGAEVLLNEVREFLTQ